MVDAPAQPGQPAAPSPPPGAGAGSAPGQPPMGSSPVSQPVPNKGREAAGLSRLSVIIKLMEETVPLLGVGSEPGKDLVKALSSLAKHVPPGAVTPGVQQSTMEKLMNQQKQMGPQIQQMRAAQAGQPPAPPGAPQAA